ncbi:unnamed protein product [Nesidiocoris tenuis]|uniref:Uncharacterized protein n=1 Tax=Nesidiocoris tenuis TaxID=355587 RepID=A0A6H5H1E4_9HEMI|nr:unnamed protein product [Nesidiocoris tenuis]
MRFTPASAHQHTPPQFENHHEPPRAIGTLLEANKNLWGSSQLFNRHSTYNAASNYQVNTMPQEPLVELASLSCCQAQLGYSVWKSLEDVYITPEAIRIRALDGSLFIILETTPIKTCILCLEHLVPLGQRLDPLVSHHSRVSMNGKSEMQEEFTTFTSKKDHFLNNFVLSIVSVCGQCCLNRFTEPCGSFFSMNEPLRPVETITVRE